PGEPDDGAHVERVGEARGQLHLLGGPPAHALGLPVAPHPLGQDPLVPHVDGVIADRLALEVVGDRPHLQPVALEQLELALDVAGLVPAPGVEMIAPAGELEAVVPPAGGEARDLFERKIGPLAGEERDRTRHGSSSVDRVGGQTWVHTLDAAALRSTASSTRCTWSPSANDGVGWRPSSMAVTK